MGERKINGNVKPFNKVESHFVDAGFFEKENVPKETMPSTITSMGRGSTENVIQEGRCARTSAPEGRKPTGGHILFCQANNYEGHYQHKVNTSSHHSMNVWSPKAPSRQMTYTTGLSGPSLEKVVYFHYIKHAIARWVQDLSLVLLVLLEAYSKKKVAYQGYIQVMGLTRMHTS